MEASSETNPATRPRTGLLLAAMTVLLITACSGNGPAGASGSAASTSATGAAAATDSPYKPTATFQEVMDAVVDPAADYIWGSVATIADKTGIHELQPRTDKEWHEFRRRAVLLVEAANLISVPGRKVANGNKTLEEGGALEPEPIQKRLDANHAQLVGFADSLRQTAQLLVSAADRKDIAAITEVGGTLDEVCEACHKVFWYPDDVGPYQTPATKK